MTMSLLSLKRIVYLDNFERAESDRSRFIQRLVSECITVSVCFILVRTPLIWPRRIPNSASNPFEHRGVWSITLSRCRGHECRPRLSGERECCSHANTTSLEQTEESEIFHPVYAESEARNRGGTHLDDDPFRLFESNFSLPRRFNKQNRLYIHYMCVCVSYTLYVCISRIV